MLYVFVVVYFVLVMIMDI